MSPSIRYLIVRALLFVVPFAVLMIAQVDWWLALPVSLAFAFAASIVFFGKLRNEAAADLQRMRDGRKREGAGPDDADIEDALLEGTPVDTASTDGAETSEAAESADDAAPADQTELADGTEPDASARP